MHSPMKWTAMGAYRGAARLCHREAEPTEESPGSNTVAWGSDHTQLRTSITTIEVGVCLHVTHGAAVSPADCGFG